MGEMNGLERIRKVLKFEEPDRVPVFPLVHFGTAHVGGVKIKEFSIDAKTNAHCLICAYKECGYDGVHPAVDVTVEGEAVGSKVQYPEDNIPFVVEPFLKSPDVNKLEMPDPYKVGRMPMIIESTRMCAREIGKEAYICPAIMGPLNCASQIRGVESLMFDFMDRADFVDELLDFTTELEIAYGKALLDAGAHSILMGEALCSPAFLSPQFYRRFVVPKQKKLISALFEHGAESTILHVCADTSSIMEDYAVNTGTNIVDLDWQIDMAWAIDLPTVKKARVTARGNLNPAGKLFTGTPEEVMNEARGLVEKAAKGGRFILGSGCDVAPDSLPKNVKAMVEASKRFGRYPV